MEDFEVKLVANNDENVIKMVTELHYAKRRPSISYAFLITKRGEAIGAITYGKPASHSLCIGVCGKEFSKNVFELNRVIIAIDAPKNLISWAIARTEKQLKNQGNFIIVSYSDQGMNHNGYIYQASNYLYTGSTKARTDKYTPNGRHSRWYNDEHNHLRKVRTAKHRYVKFVGDKKFKKIAENNLNYEVQPYPKNESSRYRLGERMKTQVINKETNEVHYE